MLVRYMEVLLLQLQAQILEIKLLIILFSFPTMEQKAQQIVLSKPQTLPLLLA